MNSLRRSRPSYPVAGRGSGAFAVTAVVSAGEEAYIGERAAAGSIAAKRYL